MGHRTVIGFMWVETTVSEIWDIPPVFSTYENSRLFRMSSILIEWGVGTPLSANLSQNNNLSK